MTCSPLLDLSFWGVRQCPFCPMHFVGICFAFYVLTNLSLGPLFTKHNVTPVYCYKEGKHPTM